jgi:3'-phosphoadenosine 5'-phosphosulfate sulfotransferase (PAPS reductase)/FAD synthetase
MNGIGWFSGGVTSAVAIKKALDDGHRLFIVYMETGSHHPDHQRFIADCEKWYGQHIYTFKNKKYKDHFDLIEKEKYINGPAGARCTLKLKKYIRFAIEPYYEYDFQVFGFEYAPKEIKRAERHTLEYPESKAIFPLIDHKLSKQDCFSILIDAGIDLPAMYKLGYSNSNCRLCVKGGMGYFNKMRLDFPDDFKRLAEIERKLGNTCLRKNGRKLYLDELDPEAGRHEDISLPECGVTCPVEFVP